MADERILGVIGGSGLYQIDAIEELNEERLETPWGEPSDAFVTGRLGETRVVFLPRHGRGHRIPPHQVNYRANIWGMKKLGVERLVGVSAVGSMREELHPGTFVVIDQFIDRSLRRGQTFFEDGVAAHVSFADPICKDLAEIAYRATETVGVTVRKGGTYLCMEGPQFSTRAESNLYRSFGVDVIGMTNATEARVAREAEICFSTVALVTDYDCWHDEEGDVDVNSVLEILRQNVDNARKLVVELAQTVPAVERSCVCCNALEHAVMTRGDQIPAASRARVQLFLDKYR